jgi:four helix bundle protein
MSRAIDTHKDLDVWQVAMDLVVSTYAMTRNLPTSEKFGLISQMRRAAVSVPSNIAEGAARGSPADFARFLVIARGSLAELETQIALIERLGLCAIDTKLHDHVTRVRQMLIVLIRKLTKET